MFKIKQDFNAYLKSLSLIRYPQNHVSFGNNIKFSLDTKAHTVHDLWKWETVTYLIHGPQVRYISARIASIDL